MCYTVTGLQLTEVSVVDMNLERVYHTLVKPSHPILDYNTRYIDYNYRQRKRWAWPSHFFLLRLRYRDFPGQMAGEN